MLGYHTRWLRIPALESIRVSVDGTWTERTQIKEFNKIKLGFERVMLVNAFCCFGFGCWRVDTELP